ncbi:MAG: DMT family transporter [Rhodospirillales bacterium]|nr:DMT family transporter [Rhodospirillales bacterium]
MTNALLYAVTVLFWGTSWLAIKFQLGVVAPEVSIVYRFGASALIMLAFCLATRRRLGFSLREHAFMAAQGLCLFSTNFLLIYSATQYLTSGLVAVAFSTITVVTIVLGALFFGFPVRPRVAAGAACGLLGIGLVFWPEIRGFDLSAGGSLGLALALAGTGFAATGMLTNARNQRAGLPVISNNAWSMAYGFAFITLYSAVRGIPFTFDPSPAYVLSLLHLAVGATVIAFWTYLTLVGRIGPDRAAYSSVLFPIVALTLSTLFEGFAWTPLALGGVVLVLAGNVLVLVAKRRV